MMGINEVLFVAAIAIVVQFLAAILGPRPLHIVSILIIMAAGALALYLANLALDTQFAGVGSDARDAATNFGLVAVAVTIGYFLMRGLFRCMARASHT